MAIYFNKNFGTNLQRTQKGKVAEPKQEDKEPSKTLKKEEGTKVETETLVSSEKVLEYLEAQAQLQANLTKGKKAAKRESLKEQGDSDKDAGGDSNDNIDNNVNPNHFGKGGGGGDSNTQGNDSTLTQDHYNESRRQANADYVKNLQKPWTMATVLPAVEDPNKR